MSIRNTLIIAYMRWKNYKADGDELTLEERQKDNMPEPPAAVAQKTACEKLEIEGARAVWLNKRDSKNGVLVYLHGGSYIAGPYGDQWTYLADMCRRTEMAGLLIDYRLAPQNPFPCGLDDVVTIVKTLNKTGELPENWFLLGDSAGAGLAAATVYKLCETNTSLPKKLILMSGWFDVTLENPDIQKNYNQDPMLSRRRLAESANSYVGGGGDPKNPLISPLYGDTGILPPALIQIGTYDMFLWDNRKFHQKCMEAGINVQYEEYANAFHDFMMVGFLPEARKARSSQVEFIMS